MKSIQNNILVLVLLGISLVILHAFSSQLSHQFIFGQGYQQRPIITFIVLMWLAGAFYIIALELMYRNAVTFSDPKVLMFICLTALMMRLVYSFSNFIQETDPYRYIWDGQAIVQGVNPYQHSPQEAIQHNFRPASNALLVQEVYRKINHEGVKTIYPPLAQGLFALSQWLTPWKIIGWKWMVTLADCMIMGVLIAIFGRIGLPKAWVIVYAWSPLVTKEFSNSVHLDVFALLMLSIMIYALVRGRQMMAYIALAGAVLVKMFAIVLLPVLIYWQLKEEKHLLPKNLVLFFGVLVLFYMPFLNAGISITGGLGRFLTEWQTNEGVFGVVRWIVGLWLPSGQGVLVSRLMAIVIFSSGLIIVMRWLKDKTQTAALLMAISIVLALLFFLSPMGNPWYYTWVVLFIPFLPLRALILFSVLVFAYYLDFYFMYHDAKSNFVFVRWVEYGMFFTILGGELWHRRLPSLSRS